MTQKKTEKSSSGKKILSEAKNSRDAAKKVKLSKSWENKSAESPHQKKVGKTEDSNIQSKLMNLVAKNAREKSSEGVQDFIRHMSMFFDRCSFSKDQISTRVENCEKKIKFLPKENMDFKIAGTKIYLNESEEKNLSLRKEMAINNTAKNFPKKSNLPERISSSASGKKLGQKPIAAKKSPASTFIGPKAQKSNDRRSDRENEIKTHFSLRSEKELSNTLQEKNMAISLKDEGARQELLKTGINASQKVKELLTATRRTKPSEIPLRKSRLDITYDSVNRSLKDKSSNFDSESSFSLTQGSSVREESFGSQKSAGLVSSNPKVLLDNNKCSQVFDDFQSKENPKLRDSPLACSPQHLPNKNSLTVTKAKVLDLDMVKSSNFAVLASGEAFQKLESFHQQVVSIKGKVFGEKSASSASTKLKQIVSKRSLGSINHSKKNNLLISLINSKSKSMLKHGRSKEAKGDFTKKRTLESPKSLIKKISRVFIDRRLKNTAKSSLNKSKKNLNAAQSYSLQDKPPSGKGSPKPPVSQEKEESKKEVKRSKISKPLGKESKPSTAESARSNSSKYSVEYNASKSSSRSTFKMTTPSFSRSKINGSELIKPVGRLTPSTPERDLRGNKTDDIDRPMTSAGKKMRTHDPDSIEKSSNDADLRDETTGGNVIKNYLNTENQTHEDNGLALQDDNLQKKESEKIHLEVRIDLETSNLMNDFLSDLEKEEKNTVEDDYLFTSYEVLKNNGEELMDEEDFQNESPIDCDYLILDEETNLEWKRLPNSTTPESSKQELTDKPILLEPYKSFSPIKRMPKCQTPPTKMKTRPKKKKVNTDSVNHSLVSTLGRYNSVTSLSGENTNIKAEAIGKNGFARGMMDNNSNYIFDDVGSVNLKRRNSEPNSLRGFVWKQPEVPIFRGNKTSVSSMASSLRHMNADELEDFRVWEPAPLKMTSHWEMSLYRYRRPWSVLSCSVFKDNRMANTPGIILESLRNGGSLDMR